MKKKNRYWQWAAMRTAVPDGNGSGGSGQQPDDNKPLSGQQDGQQRPADAPPASWDEIFQHDRFKTLIKRAKDAESELEKIKRQTDEAEQTKLKEQQRYQELYQKEQQRAAALDADLQAARQAAQNDKKLRALEAAARAHEPPFSAQALNDVSLFVDLAALDVGDDGKIKGVEAAIRDLAKSRPYMLEPRRQDPGSPGPQKQAPNGVAPQAGKRRAVTL